MDLKTDIDSTFVYVPAVEPDECLQTLHVRGIEDLIACLYKILLQWNNPEKSFVGAHVIIGEKHYKLNAGATLVELREFVMSLLFQVTGEFWLPSKHTPDTHEDAQTAILKHITELNSYCADGMIFNVLFTIVLGERVVMLILIKGAQKSEIINQLTKFGL